MTSRKEALRLLATNENWPIDKADLIYGHSACYGWKWVQTVSGDMVLRCEQDAADITKAEWAKVVRAANNGANYASTIPRNDVLRPMSRALDKWPLELSESGIYPFSMHGWGWVLAGDEMVFRSRGDVPDIKKKDWAAARDALELVATSGGHFYR
ncbi:TPA: hypothetical protein ACSCYS_004254 [Aeromonas veronii]